MRRARVLVVDDSVVVRRVLSEQLSADPALEVVGTAANGRLALARLPQLAPDVVTLDLEMPEMDGLETLRQLRPRYPSLPVLMLSRHTQRCSAAALDALALGATDYLALPSGGGLASAHQWLRDHLLPRLKQLAGPAGATPPPASRLGPPPRVDVLAIGASTGGPNALAALLGQLPADFPVPIVIVQHMPAGFTRQLAERLTSQLPVAVREAVTGAAVEPGVAWLAPGEQHMTVSLEGRAVLLRLDRSSPPENSCRPSVDVLFRSVAAVYGSGALAVILTGMGQDGLRGSEAVRAAGGAVLAQDRATSVVWGMPGYVAQAGLAQAVLPLADLGPEVATRARRWRSQSTLGPGAAVFPTA